MQCERSLRSGAIDRVRGDVLEIWHDTRTTRARRVFGERAKDLEDRPIPAGHRNADGGHLSQEALRPPGNG